MKCPECGSEIASGEKFCGNCGAPVEEVESTAATEAPATNETVVAQAPIVHPPEPEDMPPLEAPDVEAPPPPPPATSGGSNNRKTVWIIVAIVAVLLLCCCCLIALTGVFWEDITYTLEDLTMSAVQALPIV